MSSPDAACMAAFRGAHATTILVRNHELNTSSTPVRVTGGAPYDAKAGGRTSLVLGPEGELISHYGSLAGTERNIQSPGITFVIRGNWRQGQA